MMSLYVRVWEGAAMAMNPSQKNCLTDHRLTCERWGWRFLRRAAFYELLAVKDSYVRDCRMKAYAIM